MLAISETLVPLFCEMNLLKGQGFELLHRAFDLLIAKTENPRFKQELLELN